jgi:poly-gamma-glutamate capsule biosynthesis protein CapA/YwtB (metallophosphatase superfamily)
VSKRWFILILSSAAVLFALFVLFAPASTKKKVAESLKAVGIDASVFVPSLQDTQIILLGDVMLGRSVMVTSQDLGDATYPWHKVADKLSYADIVFANLETPIVEDCPRRTDGMIFCADPAMVDGLKYAGVDVVTLANNHTLNFGESGLTQTKKILSEKGIEYTDNSLAVKQVNGLTFGFVGFEFIDRAITNAQLELVEAYSEQVDVLIVGVHWGAEYQAAAGAKQREIAKKLAAAGADVVAGHHPHWVQDVEYIGVEAKPVFYSLGNFVFDQMWSQKTREGLAVGLTFDPTGKITKEERLPIYIRNWAQPEWVGE